MKALLHRPLPSLVTDCYIRNFRHFVSSLICCNFYLSNSRFWLRRVVIVLVGCGRLVEVELIPHLPTRAGSLPTTGTDGTVRSREHCRTFIGSVVVYGVRGRKHEHGAKDCASILFCPCLTENLLCLSQRGNPLVWVPALRSVAPSTEMTRTSPLLHSIHHDRECHFRFLGRRLRYRCGISRSWLALKDSYSYPLKSMKITARIGSSLDMGMSQTAQIRKLRHSCSKDFESFLLKVSSKSFERFHTPAASCYMLPPHQHIQFPWQYATLQYFTTDMGTPLLNSWPSSRERPMR